MMRISSLVSSEVSSSSGAYGRTTDMSHFLLLSPNTLGFTVLVPRKHLSSDIFSIEGEPFAALMLSAHRVAQVLKETFGTSRCGMIFEGFEIDYAHAKLIPTHGADASNGSSAAEDTMVTIAPYQDIYPSYVSSLSGPLFRGFGSLARAALDIRKMFPTDAASPPPRLLV